MTPAIDQLVAAGIEHQVLAYEHDPDAESYGLEAAEALGLDPSTVFKTLVVTDPDGSLAVGVVPVAARLDLKAMAAALGVKRVELADPALATRRTGYVVGGISPFGQKHPAPTVVDEWATVCDRVHVSAGRRGLEVAVAPDAFATVLDATFAPIAAW